MHPLTIQQGPYLHALSLIATYSFQSLHLRLALFDMKTMNFVSVDTVSRVETEGHGSSLIQNEHDMTSFIEVP